MEWCIKKSLKAECLIKSPFSLISKFRDFKKEATNEELSIFFI